MKIKVGSRVKYKMWGNIYASGVVEEIEICKNRRERRGKKVEEVDTNEHPYGTLIFRNFRWCRFDEVESRFN